MRNELRVVAVVALLTVGVSLGQGTTPATTPKAGSQKMMMLDPKMQQQMMGTAKKAHDEMESLKKAIAAERAKGGDSAMQKASDDQVAALEKTIHALREQIESGPHYLPQDNPNKPQAVPNPNPRRLLRKEGFGSHLPKRSERPVPPPRRLPVPDATRFEPVVPDAPEERDPRAAPVPVSFPHAPVRPVFRKRH